MFSIKQQNIDEKHKQCYFWKVMDVDGIASYY